MKNVILVIFCICFALFADENDQAGDENLLIFTADSIVVTASKIPQPVGSVTQKIDIIEKQEISRMVSGNRNISEIIMYRPGSSVKALSRNDANWGSYGSIGPKYSTYMLHGLPVDAFIDPQALDLSVIDRIEVQRGPASVLYPNYLSQDFAGNQSPLAGTVNLILKERVSSPKTNALFSYGSYNTLNTGLLHQNRLGSVHILGGVNYEKSDYTNYGSKNSWLNMIDNPEYNKSKLFLSATMFMGKSENHKFNFFANQTFHSGDAGRPNRGYDHSYLTGQFTYNAVFSDNYNFAFKLGYRDYDRSWEEDNFPVLTLRETDGVEQSIIPVDMHVSIGHLTNSRLLIGADYQSADYKTWAEPVGSVKSTGNDARATQLGLYLEEELHIDNLILRGGVRYSQIKNDINLLSAQVPVQKSKSWEVLLWNFGSKFRSDSKITPFFNIGNSFMSPGLKSIGGTITGSDTTVSGQIPNPDLKPENGIGLDFGVDINLFSNAMTTLRYFYTSIDDAIVENVVRQNPSQSKSVNAGHTYARGYEIEIRQTVSNRISWFANYTSYETEIRNPEDTDQDGSNIPFVPDNTANFGLSFNLPWHTSVSPYIHIAGSIYDATSLSGRTRFSGYELVNMNISKRLFSIARSETDLFINLYNITDNRFEMPWQFRDPGFSATTGFRVSF